VCCAFGVVKHCPGCRQAKAVDAFSRDRCRPDGRQVYCKECNRAHRARRRPENRLDRRRRLLAPYGLTPAQFAALLERQHGGCALCGQLIGDGTGRSLHVDHDHETGRIRGLLCAGCNTALGKFGDDPRRLRAAAEYLERC
jgi:Autographiviridae endonuclease VII